MSVIYIDLGCSDGKSTVDFIEGKSFLPELGAWCEKVYAFDPIRHEEWDKYDPSYEIEFFECAAGIDRGLKHISMTIDPKFRTLMPLNEHYDGSNRKLVKLIDFAAWLKEHVRFEDTVIVSMDIEGAEYDLMEHLITTNAIMWINHLFVEFHSDLFVTREDEYKKREEKIRKDCPIPIGAITQ
jgi:FkbM family methyltransferase